MDEKEHIRKLHVVQQLSIREIARVTGRSRQAIRKALKDGSIPVYSPRPFVGRRLTPEHQAKIQQWLEEDQKVRRKQRHTGTRMAERLREECGYEGKDAAVRNFLAKVRGPAKLKAFIPLEFDPGKSAQCDWGEADVYLGDELVTVRIFELRLNYSRALFVKAFRSENQESFFQGHVDAFAFLGGVPETIAYDNLKVAVNVLRYKKPEDEPAAPESEQGRLLQSRFISLRAHFGFGSHFCQPGKEGAHEKGGVENGIGYARRNWLVPVPRVKDMEELNAYLLRKCYEEWDRTPHGEQVPVGVRLEEELSHLLPLPAGAFPCEQVRPAKVGPYCTVTHQTHRYSVPYQHAGKKVLVHAEAETIWVEAEGKEIARHPRLFGTKSQESLLLEHYLGLLSQRPGAVENAKPVRRFLARPESELWRRVFERLGRRATTRSRDFVQLLEWRQELGETALRGALEFGLRQVDFPMDLVEAEARRLATGELSEQRRDGDWLLELEVPLGAVDHFERLTTWGGDAPEQEDHNAAA